MTTVDEFLEHHGVKGQKWGVRNDRGHKGEVVKTKKLAKLDKKFEKQASRPSFIIGLANNASATTNKNDVGRINDKPEYKNKDFTRDIPLRRKYYAEHQKAFLDNLHAAADRRGTNASGTKKYGILEGTDTNSRAWSVVLQDVKHASVDSNKIEFQVEVTYDSMQHITSLNVVDNSLVQSALTEDGQDFLEHFGVKGMRWGIRNKHNPGPSKDSKRAAQIYRKGNAGTPRALTNKEIEEFNKRVNLEQKYNKLTPSKRKISTGKVIAVAASVNAAIAFANSPAGRAVAKTIKNTVNAPINFGGPLTTRGGSPGMLYKRR